LPQKDLKAKKHLGQHFLTSEDIAQRIADSLSPTCENVLEIGPGKGILSRCLLKKADSSARPLNLKVVEIDPDMVAYLTRHFPALRGRIVAADFLEAELVALFDQQPFALIGNFPYNISTEILFRMLEHRDLIPEMVGMFQREVAERIVAPPGGRDYGITSLLVQAWYAGEYLFSVDGSQFSPPPKVQSGVIRLTRRPEVSLGCDEQLFQKLVKTAFNQRRKMLRNTLRPFFRNLDALDPEILTRRPETLSVAEFVALTNQIQAPK
jgi:16S rRNA (adenine1518-N6/adenine1519-N6)-dimethyltransferase